MLIRKATAEEMKALWNYSNSPTYNYFVAGINNKNIEFWAVIDEKQNNIVGELYIFWNSEDKDEANGINRAYLCAFRIKDSYRGQGLASKLMQTVLQRINQNGYSEVTIAVDNSNYEKLKGMYNNWGFNELLKKQNYDYHYITAENKPMYYDEAVDLYLKRL